jgi:hypothetical protein
MSEVEEDVTDSIETPSSSTTESHTPSQDNTSSHNFLSSPTKSIRVPIIPYAPKKVRTCSNKKNKYVKTESSDEESAILSFLNGLSSSSNPVIYPKNQNKTMNESNKRKWLEESSDSDSIVVKTLENDDEDSDYLPLIKNTKCRKMNYPSGG